MPSYPTAIIHHIQYQITILPGITMKKMSQFRNRLISFAFLMFGCLAVNAQVITSAEIDTLVERTLKAFDVPGIAVAVVMDNQVIHSKGYGVRSLITKQKIDENTLFGIASNSKAFTSAALGILIDDKKLSWDDKVIDYIPEFRLYNPYVTEEFTIRDLLTHRSGLGLGAGDLMIWPGLNNFSLMKQEMLQAVFTVISRICAGG